MKRIKSKTTKLIIIILSVLFLSITFTLPQSNSVSLQAQATDTLIDKPDNIFTPVLMSGLDQPNPVPGSDGKFHLLYELKLVNATAFNWQIKSVEVNEEKNKDKVFISYSGDEIKTKMQLLGDKSSTNILPSGETGFIFITFAVENKTEIPTSLSHKLTLTAPGGIPQGFLRFAELPPTTEEYIERGGVIQVAQENAIILGSPLEGKGWVAADGCCTSKRHIRAIMPIDGGLYLSQRFAIDWEMINDDQYIFQGDPQDVNSYFAYGKKVLAVKDAKVVSAVDQWPDQIPGKLPEVMTLNEADGNHVILDLGEGKFALYAHLQLGSLTVKQGDLVKKGQVIGLLGNTGNSSAPHLHFHVMSSQSSFRSHGLPYAIDEFELLGKAPSTEAFDRAEIEGIPLEVLPVDDPKVHKNELPLDQTIINLSSR